MDKKLFSDLVTSLKQAGQIAQAERKPSRVYRFPRLDKRSGVSHMRPSKHSLPIAVALAAMIIGLDGFTSIALATDPPKTYRRYDQLGRFDGTTREDEEGNLRFYDEKGQYKGYADQQDDGSWRTYDEKGEFDGTIREEPD